MRQVYTLYRRGRVWIKQKPLGIESGFGLR